MTNWATAGRPPCIPTISGPCLESYRGAVAEQAPVTLDYRLRRFDGAYRSITDCALPIHEADGRFAGYVGCCIDVSAEREAQPRAIAMLDGLIAHMNDGVFAETDAGQVAVVNASFTRIFEIPPLPAGRDGCRGAGAGGGAAGEAGGVLPGQLLPW